MKNLTILLLLMLCEYTFSQNSKLIIYSNVDSARIKIDDKDVGFAMKDSGFVVPVNPGKHNLVAIWKNETLNCAGIKIKKGQSIDADVTFNLNNLANPRPGKDSPVFLVVEEPATFQGGDLSSFNIWISQNIQYPKEAAEKGITGKVYVQFVVNETGDVEQPKILRGANQILDNEAVRVILTSPKWSPPRQGGVYVKQMFTIPVNFQLVKQSTEKLVPAEKQESVTNNEFPPTANVEEPAKFQGGDLGAFNFWALNNVKYPVKAFEAGMDGTVYVKFVVNEKGQVEDVSIVKSAGELLDQEAVRVVMSSPRWKPAKLNGKPTKQTFTMPLKFKIMN